jgi:hypothetical protein
MNDVEQVTLLRAAFDEIVRDSHDPATIGRRALACAAALDAPSLKKYSLPDLARELGISRQALWNRVDKMMKDLAEIKGDCKRRG